MSEIVFSPTLVDRFWQYVDRRGPDECWLWTGYTTRRRGLAGRKNGAGELEGRICNQVNGDRRMLRATRVSLAIATGEWHDDLEACHGACEDSLCVNPHHLSWDTHKRNLRDYIDRHGGLGRMRTR